MILENQPCRFTLELPFHKVEEPRGEPKTDPVSTRHRKGEDPASTRHRLEKPENLETTPEIPRALAPVGGHLGEVVQSPPPTLPAPARGASLEVADGPRGGHDNESGGCPATEICKPENPAGPAHLLLFRQMVEKHSLAYWAARYLAEEVAGVQAANTLEAKSRDLVAFVSWFVGINGVADIGDWLPRDTQAYLNTLEVLGRAPATINRVFATLRRFSRWAHELPGGLFGACGLPTRGIKELAVDEPDCQKLQKRDLHRLFKAADRLVLTETRADQRPRRNRAVLAMLYYTGLRVSELVALRRHQYDGRYLTNVKRKGKARSKGVYVGAECRKALDDYLQTERSLDAADDKQGALLTRKCATEPLTRQMIGMILTRIAQEANKHRGEDGALQIYPHRLRHTFGAEYRDKTGSDTETATALGHAGLSYVGRYVRKTQQEREDVIDGL
jgi:integrase/recombinase XerC